MFGSGWTACPCTMCGELKVYGIGKYCADCRDTTEYLELRDVAYGHMRSSKIHEMQFPSRRNYNGIFDAERDPHQMWDELMRERYRNGQGRN